MRSANAEEVLEWMSQPQQEGPYVLGCFGNQVTFFRQQCRAFNLIWALFSTGRLQAGNSVAVIGGGLAGMTTAAAAMSKGCKVTLFEKTGQLMGLQRDNRTRYIHSGLNDWPEVSLDETIATDLPFLNWYASDSAIVFREVLHEWESFGIEPLLNHEVTDIVRRESGFLVTWNPNFGQENFDRVVLAVGFGEEKEHPPVPFRSYWEDDSLHQGASRRGRQMRFVVSGCGDGGLIDALRLCLRDFNHRRFLHELVQRPEVQAAQADLLKIDSEARSLPPDDVPVFMLKSYRRLGFKASLMEWMKSQLRDEDEVVVTLHDRHYSPLGLRSARINRLGVFLLIQSNRIQFHRGEIGVAYLPNGKPRATINPGYQSPITIDCDQVIVRHGPERVIGQLLSREGILKLESFVPSDDPTGWPQWDKGFFTTRESRGRTQAIADYIRRKNLVREPNREFVLLPMLLPSPRSEPDDLMFATLSRLNRMAEAGDADAREAVESGEPSKMRLVLQREVERTWREHMQLRCHVARLAQAEGKYDEAWKESDAILQQAPDEREAINIQGSVMYVRREPGAAGRFQRILELSRGDSHEDRTWRTKALSNLGLIELREKNYDKAESMFVSALDEGKVVGEKVLRTVVESNLGYLAVKLKQFDRALSLLGPTLEEERGLGRLAGIAYVLDSIGEAWLGKALEVPLGMPTRKEYLQKALAALTEARDAFASLRNHREKAFCEEHLGDAWKANGDPIEAERHWSAAIKIFGAIDTVVEVERIRREKLLPNEVASQT